MARALTPRELRRELKNKDAQRAQAIIKEQASINNQNLYKFDPRPDVREAITAHVREQATQALPLTRKNPICEATRAYEHARGDDTTHAKKSGVASLFLNQENKERILSQPKAEETLERMLGIVWEGFRGQAMRFDDTIPFANHTLHATQCLSDIPGVRLEHLLATLGHDLLEDTNYAAPQTNEQHERARGQASNIARELFTGDENLDERIIIASASWLAATRQEQLDYHTYLESTKTLEEHLTTEVLTTKDANKILHEAMFATQLMKSGADKRSAGMTLQGYTTHDTLKYFGKAIATMMVAEEYRDEIATREQQTMLSQAIKNLAATVYEVADEGFDNITSIMERGFGGRKPEHKSFLPNKSIRRLNKRVERGYLQEYTPGGVLYKLLSLGYTKLRSGAVSQLLKNPSEGNEEATRRLYQEQEAIKKALPNTDLTDYRARGEEATRIRGLHGRERTRAMTQYQELLDTYLRVRLGALACAVMPQHRFKRHEVDV